jgi:hypothetical protein
MATWLDARTATASEPNCLPGAVPGCPVDLVNLLGDDLSDAYLELEIRVTPSSAGETPTANNWQITYTCPFNQ